MSSFKKATKTQSHLRLALCGPSGSGKTYTGLIIAKALGDRMAVIDTERGSASKYAGDVAEFDALELESFEPKRYVQAIHEAAAEGYPVLVIDSLSHAWMGKGGLLDQADARGGKFDAWRHLTPQHNDLVDAILAYPGHVIVTMRTKTDYLVEKDEKTGKNTVRKVGLAPVQKENVEYEFDVVGFLDIENTMRIDKSRCPALTGAIIRKPGVEIANALKAWLTEGAPAIPKAPGSSPRPVDAKAQPTPAYQELKGLLEHGKVDQFVADIRVAKEKRSISVPEHAELVTLYKVVKGAVDATKPTEAA